MAPLVCSLHRYTLRALINRGVLLVAITLRSLNGILLAFSYGPLITKTVHGIVNSQPLNDFSAGNSSTTQFVQVAGYDYHDHPKFTLRWR